MGSFADVDVFVDCIECDEHMDQDSDNEFVCPSCGRVATVVIENVTDPEREPHRESLTNNSYYSNIGLNEGG